MKITYLIFFFLFAIISVNSQTIQSTNSGAHSSDNLSYTVGDVYVEYADEDKNSSGVLGAYSSIQFSVLSTEEQFITNDVRVYPNPTSDVLTFETNLTFNNIYIYDTNGRLVLYQQLNGKSISLLSLEDGTYFVKTNNLKIKALKIIKK